MGNYTAKKNGIIVVFRFDDYGRVIPADPTEIEANVIDVFKKNNLSCTFGVIPYVYSGKTGSGNSPEHVTPLSPIKAEILKNAIRDGVVEAAQHGYCHHNIAGGSPAEFLGLDYRAQLEKITEGKNYLESALGVTINTFIPPYHVYDLTTLQALAHAGFKTISSNLTGNVQESLPLKFLPATCGLVHLRYAIGSARHFPGRFPSIVVQFHRFDFREYDSKKGIVTIDTFSNSIEWVKSQDDVHVCSVDQATTLIDDLSPRIFMLNKSIHSSRTDLFPSRFLRNLFPSNIYLNLNESVIHTITTNVRIAVSIFYLSVLAVSVQMAFHAACIMYSRSRDMVVTTMYAGAAILILFLAYARTGPGPRYKKAIPITISVGICAGLWSSFFVLENTLKHVLGQ